MYKLFIDGRYQFDCHLEFGQFIAESIKKHDFTYELEGCNGKTIVVKIPQETNVLLEIS